LRRLVIAAAWLTLSVKLWVASLPTPLCAVKTSDRCRGAGRGRAGKQAGAASKRRRPERIARLAERRLAACRGDAEGAA